MTSSDIRQYLTVKNIFIAIVALNILSTIPLSRIGGTFEHTSKKPSITALQATKAPVVDPGLVAHMMPGEHLPAEAAPSAAPAPPAWSKTETQRSARSSSKRSSNDPPGINWIMLLSIGAMALYARYLAMQMAKTAVIGAVDSVKHIAGALTKLAGNGAPSKQSTSKAAQSKSLHVARQPAKQAKSAAAPARKSTVVRASRWPFAA